MGKPTDFQCSKNWVLNQYGPTAIKYHKPKSLKTNVPKSKTRKTLNHLNVF